jgi:hypothetical protein
MRISPFVRYTVLVMPRREITPAQAFGIIAERIEKRIQTLQNMRLDGYSMVISELDLVLRQVRKARTLCRRIRRPRCGPVNRYDGAIHFFYFLNEQSETCRPRQSVEKASSSCGVHA